MATYKTYYCIKEVSIFKKKKYYKVEHLDKTNFPISYAIVYDEFKNFMYFTEKHLLLHFINKNEIRKLKLKKINENSK